MSYLLESESGLDWPGEKNRLSNKTRKHLSSYELLHVFCNFVLHSIEKSKIFILEE